MIRVLKPGLWARIEDGGRWGRQHLGLAPGGAMDPWAARAANALVGNPAEAAVLELPLLGPELLLERGLWLALAGADLSAELDGKPLQTWRPSWCPAGSRLRFGRPRWGCRAYLALAGGIAVPDVLGSRSTDERAGLGGLDGRVLRAGDQLETLVGTLPPPAAPERPWQPPWGLAWRAVYGADGPSRLRLVPGEAWEELAPASRAALLAQPWRVASQSDRMGLRLEGQALVLEQARERLSAGVAPGCLQLPPSGQPILLGAGCQTTGGYPLLARVASLDRPRWAQARPGDWLSFEAIGLEEAQALWRRAEARWREWAERLDRRMPYQR